jgi:diguanylate cyclase (GGDEF)-like protein
VPEGSEGGHLRPVLRATPFAGWWWLTLLVAGAVLMGSLGVGVGREAVAAGTGFWMLLLFMLLGELRPVVASGRTDPNGVLLATAFHFAVLLHWGLRLALIGVVVSAVFGDLLRRKGLYAAVFNASQYVISYAAAAGALHVTGWEPTAASAGPLGPGVLLPMALAAVAYHLVNVAVVGTAVGLAEDRSVVGAIFEDFAYYASTTGAVIALSPLVVVVLQHHWGLLPLLLLPLNLLYRTAAMSLEREQRSLRDDLTGIGNRALLLERLEQHMTGARPVAICLLDLDRFKEVNDTLGHGVGDEVLRLVADRLEAGVRAGDTVARLGGDEFVLLLEVAQVGEALEVVDRVVEQLQRPYEIAGARLEVAASSGVAMFPDHGTDLEALLRRADAAMYAAKEASSPTVVFTDELEHVAPSRLLLLADLRRGIGDGELEVHYQPQVRIEDGVPIRLEALVRWRHPADGLLLPGAFLPLIERTAVMRALTADVLEEVLQQLARWERTGLHLPIAVNVSLHDLADGSFVEQIAEGLRRHELAPTRLSLEITEQTLIGDPSRVLATLTELRAGGIELSLDDFGTGHASLTRLRRLPVSEVKLDRSFVEGFEGRAESRVIVTSLVQLVQGLGLRCVAEGVETGRTLAALAELGCDVAQGFHLARPMPAGQVERWLCDRLAGSVGAARPAPAPSSHVAVAGEPGAAGEPPEHAAAR